MKKNKNLKKVVDKEKKSMYNSNRSKQKLNKNAGVVQW